MRRRFGGRCSPHHQETVTEDPFDGYRSWMFGVRRPLRFMARSLDLDEAQVAQLARIIDTLKTERAQASVDERRTLSAIAEAMDKERFDAEGVKAAVEQRVKTAATLRDAVVQALEQTHGMLQPEQREKLAYLLRSGALSI